MKFYRENKVNPFASCLPLVAQLPVFLALFYMLQDDLRLDICPNINPPGTTDPQPCGDGGAASFLFIPDLTDKATGGVLVALIVLYVGSQLLSTILMSTAQDKTQRIIFLALPFVFVIFVINFPAGLLVYWITTNLWTIVQQTHRAEAPRADAATVADGEPAPMSIMDRMLHGRSGEKHPTTAPHARRVGQRQRERQRRAAPARPRSRSASPPRHRRPRRARRRSDPGDGDERAGHADRSRARAARAGEHRARPRRRGRGHRGGRADPRCAARRRPRALHRPPRPDDRRGPAPGLQGRGARADRRRRASRSTLPATGIAVARRSNARPSRRRPTPCARAVRPRSIR